MKALRTEIEPYIIYSELLGSNLVDEIEEVDSVKGKKEIDDVVNQFITDLPDTYSYDSLGCDVLPIHHLNEKNSEVWFSGKCIGVTGSDWDLIAEEFKLP
jgi:hypothetical protein